MPAESQDAAVREPRAPLIGIVGGMGPAAGVQLARHLVELQPAQRDQDHAGFVLISCPAAIGDRSEYLLGRTNVNPGIAIAAQVTALASVGATRIGIPCNSAHAPEILAPVMAAIRNSHAGLELVHLVENAVTELGRSLAPSSAVGLLATAGLVRSGTYQRLLLAHGYQPLLPDEPGQATVDEAIRGVKSGSFEAPAALIDRAISGLAGRGAQAVVLGCTELPLLLPSLAECGLPVFDPLRMLAASLLTATAVPSAHQTGARPLQRVRA